MQSFSSSEGSKQNLSPEPLFNVPLLIQNPTVNVSIMMCSFFSFGITTKKKRDLKKQRTISNIFLNKRRMLKRQLSFMYVTRLRWC